MSPPPPASAVRPWRSAAWTIPCLAVAIAVAYANALRAPFVFDDGPAVALAGRVAQGDWGAAFAAGSDAGETASGRPLLTFTLALNHWLGGENPWGYHVVNIAIHAAATALVFGIVGRLMNRRGAVSSRPGAHDSPSGDAARLRSCGDMLPIAVAALWALHPLQTQAVTYTVQRAESLMALFYLLTVYAFLRGIESGAQPSRRWLAAGVAACAAAMATKEVAVGAPLFVLLVDRTFVAGSFAAAWRARRGYYLGLAGTWVILVALVLGTGGRGGTAGFDSGVSSWHYLLTQSGAIVRYLALLIWPQPLVFDYGIDVVRELPAVILPTLLLLIVLAVTGWGMWRNAAWSVTAAFFFIVLAPSSSVVPVASQTIAEHRVYLASAGIIALAVAGLRIALGPRTWLPLALVAIAGGCLVHQRNTDYRSELALWTDTVAKCPENSRAHHNLGLAELKRGQVEIAARHFETAIRLRPSAADAHYNLGLCQARLGRPAEAIAHYERALAERPDHADAHNNLGALLLGSERTAQARAHLENAVRLRPRFAEAHCNLADAQLRAGDAAGALRSAQEALRLRPDFAEAHVHAGNAAADLQRHDDARGHYVAALRLDEKNVDARTNLANVLLGAGHMSDALPHLERVLQLAPNHLQARRNIAVLLMHLRRPAEAIPHLEVLARALPRDERVAEALREARQAAR